MANYEKQVEQEAAYPIPISLYNCYRTVRHEKHYQEYIDSYASLLLPHCPVTVVQRYRDGVCSLLFHLFFIICHPYIPLHLDFLYLLYPFLTVPNAPSKNTRGSNSDRTVTTLRYKPLHSPVITRACGRSRRGTLSKMASFIVDSC